MAQFGEMTLLRKLILMALVLSPTALPAQAAQSAVGGESSVWIGGGYSNFHADFGGSARLGGVTAFFDYNRYARLGFEGETRFLRFGNFYGEHEDNYLVGPRYVVMRHGRFRPYAKFLVGDGSIHYPFDIGHGSYFSMAPGGGLDYRLTHRWALRVDYEYQFWPGAPGISDEPSHGLNPNGVTVGVMWRLF